jgi:hypothetical protein
MISQTKSRNDVTEDVARCHQYQRNAGQQRMQLQLRDNTQAISVESFVRRIFFNATVPVLVVSANNKYVIKNPLSTKKKLTALCPKA